ncbi:hypothetical protein GSUB_17185 (plasmid) [Geoalkalibacter subterraneus]|uniref:TNase-like domain-containing protein n=1 Tax=Geoalkalibacter subterraneus TaxID=483547 RepID=A0A0B5FW08_9BACT|nr:hypothetical protein GSUB_17185 [Geoalkalibacter subterraneus]
MTFTLFLFLFLTSSLYAFTAQVVKVSDGDTITVLTEDKKEARIRFYGVDTPERGQAFGRVATEHLKTLLTPTVEIEVLDQDRYGRLVGLVYNSAGTNLNQQMVADGYAWVYTRYCSKSFCSDWKQLQNEARSAASGLWRDRDPVPPWQWRQGKRSSSHPDKELSAPFSGNTESQVAHRESCRHYDCKHCSVEFQTAAEAKNAGFRLCRMCN